MKENPGKYIGNVAYFGVIVCREICTNLKKDDQEGFALRCRLKAFLRHHLQTLSSKARIFTVLLDLTAPEKQFPLLSRITLP